MRLVFGEGQYLPSVWIFLGWLTRPSDTGHRVENTEVASILLSECSCHSSPNQTIVFQLALPPHLFHVTASVSSTPTGVTNLVQANENSVQGHWMRDPK